MSFTREKIRDFYLLATDVENIFINEYMPAAPGDFVKVYLYGLLYSQNDAPMSYDQMAGQLSMSRKRIDEAWDYWASMGVVEKSHEGGGSHHPNRPVLLSFLQGLCGGDAGNLRRGCRFSG